MTDDSLPAAGSTDLEMYFDPERNCFLVRELSGRWMRVSWDHAKKLAVMSGKSAAKAEGQKMSAADAFLTTISMTQVVDYSGPLAGFNSGYYENLCGNRVLVMRDVHLLEPKPGDWPTLRAVFTGMLEPADPQQVLYFYSWLKTAWEALRVRKIVPGQAVVFVGPASCGKSLVQHLITEILGSRVAKPFRYMTGDTQFNAELFGAEHLMIEDEQAKLGIQERRLMGTKIKEFTVCRHNSCHPKGRQAFNLPVWWRLTISLNDEGENVTALPPLDDSVADKIMVFRCSSQEMPMPTGDHEQQEAFWRQLKLELPGFLHWLEHEFTIPEEIRGQRYRVKAYHHESIVEMLKEAAPETRMLDLIDQAIFTDNVPAWEGTASQLQTRLFGDVGVRDQSRDLLRWPNATGMYLGRLAGDMPGRVQRAAGYSRNRRWIIARAENQGI